MRNSKRLSSLLFLLLFLFIIIFIIRHIYVFLDLLKLVFYGLTFAYIFLPVIEFLEKLMQPSKAFFSFVVLILIFFLASIFLFLPILNRELTALVNKLPVFISKSKEFYRTILDNMEFLEIPTGLKIVITEKLDKVQMKIGNSLFIYIQKFINWLSQTVDIVIAIVFGFYFLRDRKYFKRLFVDMVPSTIRQRVLKVFREIDKILRTFIRTQLLISLVICLLSTMGFMIIRLQYAFILGLFCGLFEIIPYFGPLLGAIPALIVATLNGVNSFIWTTFIVILVQQIEGNIITPQIIGYNIELHPAIIILILWLGRNLFGIGGMFFAVPIFLIFRIIVKNIYISIVSNRLV